MCFRKKVNLLPDYTNNTIISLVTGNYPGTANDLAGPPYDQVDFEKMVLNSWSHYVFRKYKDSTSTANNFLTELRNVVSQIREGDLLLFIMDTCFSESNTKNTKPPNYLQNRVYHNPKYPVHKLVTNRLLVPVEGMNYISMSACLSRETAADAVFDHPNGAQHYALIKTALKGITYRQWDQRASALLKQLGFSQTCTIEGPDALIDRKIFEGNVYCFEISGHGSHCYDENGDEPDKQDEGPYFYDRMVIDDEIQTILQTNKWLVQ